jgi:hypothetical protein
MTNKKKIVLHAASFDTFWAHYFFDHDQDFIDKLESLGYCLFFSNQTELKDADIILFCEATSVGLHRIGLLHKIRRLANILLGRIPLNSSDIYKECQLNRLFDKTALLIAEGIIHMPENHNSKLGRMFPVVFTWNDNLVDGKRFFKYRIPQPVQWPKIKLIPFKDKKLLVNISANKYSSHHSELYSTRRTSIEYFEKKIEQQFELYGIGWNEPVTIHQPHVKTPVPYYSSYKGIVNRKVDVYPKFRFALCYENSMDPGYITEKVFDCMRSDCVPIYLGAPNINDYIPANTFIDRRQFSSDEQLADFILNIDENKYENYRESISIYLSSDQFSSFLCTSLAETIIKVIEKYSENKI